MTKGGRTRTEILRRALEVASRGGLAGLTIGGLADVVGMSKAGLFAHFGSKEALQEQVVGAAVEQFRDAVIVPALAAAPGIPRLEALLARWMVWDADPHMPGGCPFVGFSAELDHQPGGPRDALALAQSRWMALLSRLGLEAVASGQLKADTETELFAFQFHGIVLSYHQAQHLLGDQRAEEKARRALASLVAAHRE